MMKRTFGGKLTLTTADVTRLLFTRGAAYFTTKEDTFIFQSIEREDGSGNSFNLYATAAISHEPYTFYVVMK
jgi:hypothetical protein